MKNVNCRASRVIIILGRYSCLPRCSACGTSSLCMLANSFSLVVVRIVGAKIDCVQGFEVYIGLLQSPPRLYENENDEAELSQLETTDRGDEATLSADSFEFLGADGGEGNSDSSSPRSVHKAGGLRKRPLLLFASIKELKDILLAVCVWRIIPSYSAVMLVCIDSLEKPSRESNRIGNGECVNFVGGVGRNDGRFLFIS